jgi:hypothetical protein
MIAAVFASLRAMGGGWQDEARRRRKISATDPIADSLDYCAGELGELVRQLEADTAWLTPGAYAEMHDVTPQTVRAWIRRGELDARDAGSGWLIRRSAVRKRALKKVA